MIPASYLFKDAFQQAFQDPDFTAAAERHRNRRPGRPILSWLRRQPRGATSDVHSGAHHPMSAWPEA